MKTDLPNNQQRPTVAKPLLYDVLKECLSTTITDAEKNGDSKIDTDKRVDKMIEQYFNNEDDD